MKLLIKFYFILTLIIVNKIICTIGQKKKTKKNTPIFFNPNYHTEMKLKPININ